LKDTQILVAPRVGLSLNKYDEFKEEFWMSDYRFSSQAKNQKKFGNQFALDLIRQGLSLDRVCEKVNISMKVAEEMR
jgi:hypothetical protein